MLRSWNRFFKWVDWLTRVITLLKPADLKNHALMPLVLSGIVFRKNPAISGLRDWNALG